MGIVVSLRLVVVTILVERQIAIGVSSTFPFACLFWAGLPLPNPSCVSIPGVVKHFPFSFSISSHITRTVRVGGVGWLHLCLCPIVCKLALPASNDV